ncbi:MAG: NAD(P)/FAD-dependent oxidoreductase [Actinomycetota bacterium]
MVGAGFAGLSAARALQDRGVATTVLDARFEPGGRVRSSRLPNGSVIELGGEWIMPGDAEIRTLCDRFGLALAPTRTDYRRRTPAGPGAPSLAAFESAVASAATRLATLDVGTVDAASIADFLDGIDTDPGAVATLRMRLQGTCAVDLARVPLASLEPGDLSLDRAEYLRCEEGNQSVAVAIADSLADVRLRHRVTRVRQEEGSVRVFAERADGREVTVSGTAAVIAVPVTIVPEIAFEPPLPVGVSAALRERPMGVAAKLAVAIEPGARPRSVQSARIPMWCWIAAGADGRTRPTLTSFCGSPAAVRALKVAGGDPTVWLERLRELVPDVALEGRARLQVWADEPFARGAYSALDAPGRDRLPLLQERWGSVAFAGEHVADPDHVGTMEGALRSGRHAAQLLIELLV